MTEEDTQAKCDEWIDSWMQPTKAVPSTVYYYCSVDTLSKILGNKTIWLTNLFFLNDREEHFWLRTKARSLIAEKVSEYPDEFGYQYLETILRQDWRHEIYCACFSEQADLLSQWRAYGDDGKGFAIGFSTEHLKLLSSIVQGGFANVVYAHEDQRAFVESAFELFPRLCDGEDPTIEEGSVTILRRISEAASRCKSKAFSEEAEWRVVCEPSYSALECESIWTKARSPRFVERRGIITPFMEIPLVEGESYRKRGNEPIKEIVFGPKNSSPEQRYAVEMLLSRGGFKRVQLRQSEVSYR
jgi:hypothetical protein